MIQTNFNQLWNLCLVALIGSSVDVTGRQWCPDDKPWQTVHIIGTDSELIELISASHRIQ